jgi:hypothetical protein
VAASESRKDQRRDRLLHIVALFSLIFAILSAIAISIDEMFNPQPMWIMNVVWPVTALYFGVFALLFYFLWGRRRRGRSTNSRDESKDKYKRKSFRWFQIALSTSHCGAGCSLADLVTEFTLFGLGVTILGSQLWASYVWDFVAAWVLGIAFQYFAIMPMRHLSRWQGLWAAAKADTFSILAFQIGMYSWMALVYFRLFRAPHLHPNEAMYWFMMQIGMICGFATAYPMNQLLLKIGWKETMD